MQTFTSSGRYFFLQFIKRAGTVPDENGVLHSVGCSRYKKHESEEDCGKKQGKGCIKKMDHQEV